MAAHIDLFRGRETQVYLYSSLERTSTRAYAGTERDGFISRFDTASEDARRTARTQFLSLLRYIKDNLSPDYLASLQPSNGLEAEAVAEADGVGVPKIPISPDASILLGSVHTGLLGLLSVSGRYPDTNAVPGIRILRMDVDVTCSKYVFSRETYSSPSETGEGEEEGLPNGYTFSRATPYSDTPGFGGTKPEAELVNSRTRIYRSRESLGKMSGVAIYPSHLPGTNQTQEVQAIGWAFITFDGSLATLHVEREHRGRGLAGCLIRETLRRAMGEGGMFGGLDGEGLVHVDVEAGNEASARVMKKSGGRLEWTDGWVVVGVDDDVVV